ncbi:MAG: acyl-CoA dehydrogenase family protein [Halioglobus sp.]|nr:acyl-CoA dehydrogenase family protein [Halioglobus sp.]
MNLVFSEADLAFQQEVRNFLVQRLPVDIRDRCACGYIVGNEDLIRWQKILNEQGWMAPNWPVEYGGTGWSLTQKYIAAREFASACAPLPTFGITMLGPVLIAFGSDAQKARYLPRILRSDDVWCQGYSEPGAGSDLARLKTRAVRDGDQYIVNGQKLWTSYAHWADMMFCLVRTDPDAKAQDGISFILIDMKIPGIEIRPIIGLDMGHTLNEVFLEDVRVPVENLVGEENKGWTYAKYLLQKERNFVARVAQSRHLVARLKIIAAEQRVGDGHLIDSADFKRRLTSLEIDLRALEYSELRYLSRELHGEKIGLESSILKIKGSEIQQGLKKLLVESLGMYSAPYENDMMPIDSDYLSIGPQHMQGIMAEHLYGRAATIFGGSNEIQRNILARQLLR